MKNLKVSFIRNHSNIRLRSKKEQCLPFNKLEKKDRN